MKRWELQASPTRLKSGVQRRTRAKAALCAKTFSIPVLGSLAIALSAAALFWLWSLSRKIERLQSRLDAALPEEVTPVSEEAAAPAVVSPSAQLASPQRSTDRGGLLGWARERRRRSRPAVAASERPGWMVWLGGVSVALAGIFLVKYSIDQGLLTPWARVALGTAAGLAMHALAEWTVRKTARSHPALSALAAGASLTLCAAVLAALHLYELIPAALAFVVLAAVSMATMALALRHGPVLAALGLIGCYVVPLLVGGDGGSIVDVLAYCLIVGVTVISMLRYAYRRWLWWGAVIGSLFWWMTSIGLDAAHGFRGIFLALVAAALVFLPAVDWWPRLRAIPGLPAAPAASWQPLPTRAEGLRAAAGTPLFGGMFLLILAHAISVLTEPFGLWTSLAWLPLVVVVLVAGRFGGRFAWLAWLSLGTQVLAWLVPGLTATPQGIDWQSGLDSSLGEIIAWAASMAAAYTLLAWWHHRQSSAMPVWTALAVVSPPTWLAVAYALAADMAISPGWALASVVMGAAYAGTGWLFSRAQSQSLASWTVLGCSASYALAASMLFREAGLTLALAVQAIPLAWLAARHGTAQVSWVTKAVLLALVARLTLNPWLSFYAAGPHWTVWTYGGSALSCMLASPLASPLPRLRRWIEVVAAHLLVLACWAIARDLLYDGDVFSGDYLLADASINTAVWAALGLLYYRRSQVGEFLAGVHLWTARVLLTMSVANYAIVLFPLNPVVTGEDVSSMRIWNVLLLAYGAPVLLAFLTSRYYERGAARFAGAVSGIALFAFVTIEIRHLWQGGLEASARASDAEMATYSLVWLCMAVTAMLAGGMRYGADVYRGGMAVLLVTVCKVFLYDMSGLTGLLRAGSFMGLGLSLLGLAYLHQRFKEAGTGLARGSE